LVSRYVDDDLEGEDLEAFLEHLSECAACREEVGALERLRGWLHTADSLQGIPEMSGEWGLADLLQKEESSEATDSAEPISRAISREAASTGKEGSRAAAWIRRYLLPFPVPTQRMVRFALPLLVVSVVAAWLYTRETSNWIDVRELQPSQEITAMFPQEEAHREVDMFVMQHTTHQPWANHGDEFPMIELASGSSP
jgi:anti-sigma factor RsiW